MKKWYFFVLLTSIAVNNMYAAGVPDPDPRGYTVPVHGRIVSDETSNTIKEISITYNPSAYYPDVSTYTDSNGYFLFYLPEYDSYNITFRDVDGFKNGGFFTQKKLIFTREDLNTLLEIRLHRETNTSVIHGTVFSEETGESVSNINFRVNAPDDDTAFGFNAFAFEGDVNENGEFSIELPVRNLYSIRFSDYNNLMESKYLDVTLEEIKEPLKVFMKNKN